MCTAPVGSPSACFRFGSAALPQPPAQPLDITAHSASYERQTVARLSQNIRIVPSQRQEIEGFEEAMDYITGLCSSILWFNVIWSCFFLADGDVW